MLIKNGKVVIFENNDVIVKNIDLKIEEGKIVKIFSHREATEENIIHASTAQESEEI